MAGTGLVGQNRCLAFDRGGWDHGLNNGQWLGETTFGELNASNDWYGLLIEPDGFTVEPTSDLITDDVQDCSVNAPKQIKTGDTFEGQVIAALRPTTAKMLLDILVGRNSADNLQSWSAQHHAEVDGADTDGGVGYNYLGLTCFSATINASTQTGKAVVTATMRCRKRNAISAPVTMAFTDQNPYLFKNSRAVVVDGITGERFAEGDFESITIEINNNGQPGRVAREFFESPPSAGGGEFSGLVESLLMGRTDVRGTATIKWKEARWDRMQAQHAKLIISLGFFHPTSIRSISRVALLAQGATQVDLLHSPGAWITSPPLRTSPRGWGVLAIEGRADNADPDSVEKTEFHPFGTSPLAQSPFSTKYDLRGNGIRWSGGIGVSPGFIYNKAMELCLPDCRITNVQKTGPNQEQLRCNITFIAQKNTTASEDRFGFSGDILMCLF